MGIGIAAVVAFALIGGIVVVVGIVRYYYLAQLNKSEDTKAKAQITVISKAVEVYVIEHEGQRPDALEALLVQDAAGFGPYLEGAESITTPWGGMYQYDPNGPNNGGRKPDVWVNGPRGTIGNWPLGR
jgi:hypothetical protein